MTFFYPFQVWVTFQDNVLHYLSNTLLLPLVIRSNRTISRWVVFKQTELLLRGIRGIGANHSLLTSALRKKRGG